MKRQPHNCVYEKILANSEAPELKSCLAIKELREHVLTNPVHMRKLPLFVSDSDYNSCNDFARNYGKYVMIANIKCLETPSIHTIKPLLDLLPNLERLEICSYDYSPSSKNNTEELLEVLDIFASRNTSLKELDIHATAGLVFELLTYYGNCRNIEKLKLSLVDNDELHEKLGAFLNQQTRLNELYIEGKTCTFLDYVLPENVSFRLQAFTYNGRKSDSLIRFLRTQTRLQNFFSDLKDIHQELGPEILLGMQNITIDNFTMDLKDIMQKPSFLARINNGDYIMENLQSLTFKNELDTPRDQDLYENIFKIFPNIKKLKMTNMFELNFGFLNRCSQLEEIHVENGCFASLYPVKLPNLKTVIFDKMHSSVENIEVWRTFSSNNPKVDTMKFLTETVSVSATVDQINAMSLIMGNWPKMEKLIARFNVYPQRKNRNDEQNKLSVVKFGIMIESDIKRVTYSGDFWNKQYTFHTDIYDQLYEGYQKMWDTMGFYISDFFFKD